MKYRRDQEQQLLEDILSFSHDPEGFSLYAYPWGEKGTPLEHSKGPRGWQREVNEEIKHHIIQQQLKFDLEDLNNLEIFREAIASGRGIGKSAEFGMLANWMVSTHLGSAVQVTANTESQMRTKTFPEFARWFTLAINGHWWDPESLAVRPQDWIASLLRDQLKIDTKYWGVFGQNWSEENPDAFAGLHNNYGLAVFFDESSGIPEPIWKVTHGFFTELNPFRLWITFSNPRRNSGAFFDRFNDPNKGKGWRTRQIDSREVEGVDPSIFQSIIDEYGEHSDTARVEVYGQFPEQGEGQLIANSLVLGAQQREIHYSEDNDQPVIMGVDPAPRGRTVIRMRQGRDAKSFPVTVLNGADNKAIADKVVELINRFNPDAVAVDAGNGTGVIDDLVGRNVRVHEVWFGNKAENTNGEFALMSGQLWGDVRDWLSKGSIDKSPTLYRDLTVRTWKWYGGTEDGKKALTSKRDMEKDGIPSPDDADALALTFYPKVPKRNKSLHRGVFGATAPVAAGVSDWDFA